MELPFELLRILSCGSSELCFIRLSASSHTGFGQSYFCIIWDFTPYSVIFKNHPFVIGGITQLCDADNH